MNNLMDIYMDALSLTLMGRNRAARLDQCRSSRSDDRTACAGTPDMASQSGRPSADVIAFPVKSVVNGQNRTGNDTRSAA